MISTIYERLLKAKSLVEQQTVEVFGAKTYTRERFDLFISLVLLTLNSDRKIEPNNYEDLLRDLLGKDAYLLFVYDKLIATVSDVNCWFLNLDPKAYSECDDDGGQQRKLRTISIV